MDNDGIFVNLICSRQDNTNECTDQQFNDLESFQVFKTALDSAEKMPGMINYLAEYNLEVKFQDQATKAFHLSLGTNRDMKGLLVDLENTNEGYEIPVIHANKLRELIEG
ncbi:hypothetical protein MHI37_09440 [Paenibacillus sp. FSL H8-0548]|uniref:hypothetical protein n=1 Tax=Paenibacillus sp. FSL H8-0548 TaxID=1920422 RepID=UPI00117EFC86|nr:hypothetical protein [Paenibacillus sp. FSL H8-0548]